MPEQRCPCQRPSSPSSPSPLLSLPSFASTADHTHPEPNPPVAPGTKLLADQELQLGAGAGHCRPAGGAHHHRAAAGTAALLSMRREHAAEGVHLCRAVSPGLCAAHCCVHRLGGHNAKPARRSAANAGLQFSKCVLKDGWREARSPRWWVGHPPRDVATHLLLRAAAGECDAGARVVFDALPRAPTLPNQQWVQL